VFWCNPEAQSVAYSDQAGPDKLETAITIIYDVEKKARLAGDLAATRKACIAAIELCFDARDWKALSENTLIISKKRAQLKQVITEVVQKVMTYVEETDDTDTKLDLLDTLRTVTEGKIYVELERARISASLVKIKEEQGLTEEAANILQEVQVETIGTMDKREKTGYILEQMRLCLAKQDFIRTAIISKKINPDVFKDETIQDLKVKFYDLSVQMHAADKAYLEIAKCYYAIFDTPSVQKNDPNIQHGFSGMWADMLKAVALFLILSPYDNEQVRLRPPCRPGAATAQPHGHTPRRRRATS
jgi:26S proteasome regulatory subunit N5